VAWGARDQKGYSLDDLNRTIEALDAVRVRAAAGILIAEETAGAETVVDDSVVSEAHSLGGGFGTASAGSITG
jgi:hypothetical protein